jgi:predicted transcriptional regulator
MINKTKEILKEFGLTNGEIDTYLMSLKIGPSTVLDLANATKLTRQSIYNAADKLASIGLMRVCTEESKQTKMYFAEAPTKLMSLINQKRDYLEYMVNDLQSVISVLEMEVAGNKPVAKMMQGQEGLVSAMQEICSRTCGGYEMVDFAALQQILTSSEFDVLHKVVKNEERDVTGLYASCPPSVAGMVRQAHRLKEEDGDFKSVIAVFEYKIVMVSFCEKPYTLVIDDKNLAKSLGLLFKYSAKYLQDNIIPKDVQCSLDKMTSEGKS